MATSAATRALMQRRRRSCPGARSGPRRTPRLPTHEVPDIDLASAHVITGFFALCHSIGLLPEELKLLDEKGGALGPALWSETRAMLELADRADGPTSIELGFEPLIYHWLGIRDEAAFIEHYGLRIDEALAVDAGSLSRFASSLEQGAGARATALQLPASHAWCARASRLMDDLRGSGEAVLIALERALHGLPWDPETIRPLGEAIARVAVLLGDEPRAQAARRLLAMVEDSDASSSTGSIPLLIASQILTVLHALTHEGMVLADERALEPGIDPSGWDAIATAVREGRYDDVPAPVRLLPVWGAPPDLPAEAVRDCLRRCAVALPHLLDELDRLWGGRAVSETPDGVARAMAAVAVIRHLRVQRAYSPPDGERHCIWFEAHQGQRRKEAVEVAALLRRLRAVLLRCEVDPLAVAAAHLDAADEHQARGEHDATEAALRQAVRYAETYRGDPSRRNHAAVSLARHVWQRGRPDAAIQALRKLEGEGAQELLRQIDSREDARTGLREAVEEYDLEGTISARCEVGIANLLSGHDVSAEVVGREVAQHHPQSGLASHTLASVLTELGRYRDAIAPGRRALDLAEHPTADRASLARVLARIGDDGREEAAALARQVLASGDASSALTPDVLAELAQLLS